MLGFPASCADKNPVASFYFRSSFLGRQQFIRAIFIQLHLLAPLSIPEFIHISIST
jgi:hypothetical protein